MNMNQKRNDGKKGTLRGRISAMLCTAFLMAMCWGNVAFASYGENIYNGFLKENLLWIAIAAVVIVVLGCAAKRNYTGIIITIIVGAIVIFLIMTPEKLKELATFIGNIAFSQG